MILHALNIIRPDFRRSDAAIQRELEEAVASLAIGRIHHRRTKPDLAKVKRAKTKQPQRELYATRRLRLTGGVRA